MAKIWVAKYKERLPLHFYVIKVMPIMRIIWDDFFILTFKVMSHVRNNAKV
jgi:hypothetical protein